MVFFISNLLHKSKKCVSILHVAALFVFLVFLSITFLGPVKAQAEKMNKLLEFKQKIRNVLDNVSESKEEEKAIRTNIQNINETIGKKAKELRDYDKRMSQTQAEVSSLEKDIEMLTSELDSKKPYLKKYINFIYKQQAEDNAFVLVSSTDYQDLALKSKYVSLITNYEGRVIQKYVNDIREINSRKKDLAALLDEIEAHKEDARNKKKELQANLSKKDELLFSVREKQAAYEKRVKDLEASSQKIQGMVTTPEKKKIPEAITGSGFATSKGRLPWPIDGKVLIAYGQYNDPVFNTPVFKNGIEIGARPDDVPRSVAGGRVIYAGSFEGYGSLIIIDHGNGYNTLYGNLSEFLLQKGDLLIKGTDLGKVTKSKFTNTPALYFEIRYNGKPVNPVEWLEKHG